MNLNNFHFCSLMKYTGNHCSLCVGKLTHAQHALAVFITLFSIKQIGEGMEIFILSNIKTIKRRKKNDRHLIPFSINVKQSTGTFTYCCQDRTGKLSTAPVRLGLRERRLDTQHDS